MCMHLQNHFINIVNQTQKVQIIHGIAARYTISEFHIFLRFVVQLIKSSICIRFKILQIMN